MSIISFFRDPFNVALTLIVLAAILLYLLKKVLDHYALFRRVSWIIGGDQYDNIGTYGVNHLRECLLYKSENAKAESPFHIDPEEYAMLNDILRSYKLNLAHSFFRNQLIFPWRFRKMDERDYLFLPLNSYLSKHETDHEFCGHVMHEHIESEYYKGGGHKGDYHLTDFGVVFTKLRYLALVYCIQTPSTNHDHLTIDYADYLRNELLTGTTTILCYRP